MAGRIRRKYKDKKTPLIIDYVDMRSSYLRRIAKKRLGMYKRMQLNIKNTCI